MVVLLAGLGATLAGPAIVGYMINNGLVAHQSMMTVTICGIAYLAVERGLLRPHPAADPPGLGYW